MGASESSLSSSQRLTDEITTVTEKSETVDPILEKLKSLKFTNRILTSPLAEEGSLTDILVRKASSSSAPATVNPNVLLELFSLYRDWQEGKVGQISKKQSDALTHQLKSDASNNLILSLVQEDVENKIEVADALAIKLLQRFNYSVSAMKTMSQHLSEVHALQVEIGELKGRLTEVLSNCDALCKRIATDSPESLRSSVKPFALAGNEPEISSSSPSVQSVVKCNPPNEAKSD